MEPGRGSAIKAIPPLWPGCELGRPRAAPKSPTLASKRLQSAEFARQNLLATIAADREWSDVLAPAYWTPVASKIQRGDIISCRHENLVWIGEVICLGTWPHIVFQELWHKVLSGTTDTKDYAAASGYDVEGKGLNEGFVVLRKSDGVTMTASPWALGSRPSRRRTSSCATILSREWRASGADEIRPHTSGAGLRSVDAAGTWPVAPGWPGANFPNCHAAHSLRVAMGRLLGRHGTPAR